MAIESPSIYEDIYKKNGKETMITSVESKNDIGVIDTSLSHLENKVGSENEDFGKNNEKLVIVDAFDTLYALQTDIYGNEKANPERVYIAKPLADMQREEVVAGVVQGKKEALQNVYTMADAIATSNPGGVFSWLKEKANA